MRPKQRLEGGDEISHGERRQKLRLEKPGKSCRVAANASSNVTEEEPVGRARYGAGTRTKGRATHASHGQLK